MDLLLLITRNGLDAPCENITSLGSGNNSATFSGTSAAVPFVTGIIALLWSSYSSLTVSVIKHAVSMANNLVRYLECHPMP